MSHLIPQKIIKQHCAQLLKLRSNLQTLLAINPFRSSRIPGLENLHMLDDKIILDNLQAFRALIQQRRISPPLLVCSLDRSLFLALLNSTDVHYSQHVFRKLLETHCLQLNDSLRELNDNGLEETDLRQIIITCRDQMEPYMSQLVSLPEDSYFSKAINAWMW